MLCSIRGLDADASREEVESSSCSLLTTPSLMFLTTSLFGTYRKCSVPKKARPFVELLDCKFSADIPCVPASALPNYYNGGRA